MTASFVDGVSQYVDGGEGAGTIVCDLPTGAAVGDIILLVVNLWEWGTYSTAPTVSSTPSGFTAISNANQAAGDGFNWLRQYLYYRVVTGSEGSSVSIALSASYSDAYTHLITDTAGVHVSTTWTGGAWTLSRRLATVTTTVDDCLVIGTLHTYAGEDDSPAPSGWTYEYSVDPLGASDGGFVWSKVKSTAGATGNTDFNETDNYTLRVGHTVTFKPEIARTATGAGTGSSSTSSSFFTPFDRTATSSGAGSSAATGVREVLRTATSSGTGSSSADSNVEGGAIERTATGGGTGSAATASYVSAIRTASGSATGSAAAEAAFFSIFSRTATSSGTGDGDADFTIELARTATSSGTGSSSTSALTSHMRTATGSGEGVGEAGFGFVFNRTATGSGVGTAHAQSLMILRVRLRARTRVGPSFYTKPPTPSQRVRRGRLTGTP